MQTLDLLVLGGYLAVVVWFGARLGRRQAGVRDYFLAGRRAPWWALMASIVATETSTVTLISVPGYAFAGDFTFLQLAFGYIVGRVLVALVLVPAYFRGALLTAYQLLSDRFGPGVGRMTASIFIVTRTLADGFRLFATGLVLAAVLATIPGATEVGDRVAPGLDGSTFLVVVAIGLIGVTTLVYTLLGGMRAVIWTDVIQLTVYVVGSVVAAVILLNAIPGGWTEVTTTAGPAGKLRLFDMTLDLTRSYTFWAAVVGGIFLTAGTHGTDQLLVQRYLCGRSVADARRALIVSGFVVAAQFTLFLAIGTMLWVYYSADASGVALPVDVDGVVLTDRVFPLFMMTHLPVGVRGIMVAAIVAAAMSTLSSSLNSTAASTIGDFYMPLTGSRHSDGHYLRASRLATVGWAVLQMGVALAAIELSSRVVDEVLGIQSFTGGLITGVFLLGLGVTRRPAAATAGLIAGTMVLLAVRLSTAVSWQWYALIGTAVTVFVGWITSRVFFGDGGPRQTEVSA